jgi:shikimate dehydrogenase
LNIEQNYIRVALVGEDISASLTPAMHEAEGKELGLHYSYRLIDTNSNATKIQSLAEIIAKAQSNGYAGLNITFPYKIQVLQCLDKISRNTKMLGAANTVVFSGDRKIGYNTDITGFYESFRREMSGAIKDRVLLLGAGGAGVAVAFALANLGVRELLIYDIDADQTKTLINKVRLHQTSMSIDCINSLEKSILTELNGVVNATPMGMVKYPGSAFPLNLLTPSMWVADIVYFPLETELLVTAQTTGCRVMNGAGMAIFQAVHAFELFTGLKANVNRFIEKFEVLKNSMVV